MSEELKNFIVNRMLEIGAIDSQLGNTYRFPIQSADFHQMMIEYIKENYPKELNVREIDCGLKSQY
jgi:hypothetical protein